MNRGVRRHELAVGVRVGADVEGRGDDGLHVGPVRDRWRQARRGRVDLGVVAVAREEVRERRLGAPGRGRAGEDGAADERDQRREREPRRPPAPALCAERPPDAGHLVASLLGTLCTGASRRGRVLPRAVLSWYHPAASRPQRPTPLGARQPDARARRSGAAASAEQVPDEERAASDEHDEPDRAPRSSGTAPRFEAKACQARLPTARPRGTPTTMPTTATVVACQLTDHADLAPDEAQHLQAARTHGAAATALTSRRCTSVAAPKTARVIPSRSGEVHRLAEVDQVRRHREHVEVRARSGARGSPPSPSRPRPAPPAPRRPSW